MITVRLHLVDEGEHSSLRVSMEGYSNPAIARAILASTVEHAVSMLRDDYLEGDEAVTILGMGKERTDHSMVLHLRGSGRTHLDGMVLAVVAGEFAAMGLQVQTTF